MDEFDRLEMEKRDLIELYKKLGVVRNGMPPFILPAGMREFGWEVRHYGKQDNPPAYLEEYRLINGFEWRIGDRIWTNWVYFEGYFLRLFFDDNKRFLELATSKMYRCLYDLIREVNQKNLEEYEIRKAIASERLETPPTDEGRRDTESP